MIRGRTIRAALVAAISALVLLPAFGSQASAAPTAISMTIRGGGANVRLLDKIEVNGQAMGLNPGESLDITVSADGRELDRDRITPGGDGIFTVPVLVSACCRYTVKAASEGIEGTANFTVDVPKKLGKGKITQLFNKSLQAQGFHTGTNGSRITPGTHLAIKAFRKVNGMRWSEAYSPAIFRTLLQGKGAFQPRFDDGKHVEVDISKQVMALVDGKTPVHTFHVSTGTGGTPTVQGNYHFYMKQPGYNAKQMYYSVYFIAGYATHGYSEVPNHNASHGCVRNPIPFSRFIYNWIDIGDPMHTYS